MDKNKYLQIKRRLEEVVFLFENESDNTKTNRLLIFRSVNLPTSSDWKSFSRLENLCLMRKFHFRRFPTYDAQIQGKKASRNRIF